MVLFFKGDVVGKIIFDFDTNNACIESSEIKKISKKIIPEIKKINETLSKGYDTDYASINVPSDKQMLDLVHTLIKEKKKLEISAVVVIGIGGSNLGTIAIHKALQGTLYNEKNPQYENLFF